MPRIKAILRAILPALAVALAPEDVFAQTVATYHNDTLRTGWNAAETALTVASVGGGGFHLQTTTALDSQVDSQPLVVPNQAIGSLGTHTAVYVVTGGNTLYAIDGITGSVLTYRNFGKPVPQSALPGQCNNNGPSVGITSTPVIDTANGTLYLIADTFENGQAVFRVHAVSLSTLQDSLPPVVVNASAQLSDGTAYKFNANVSRQRAALLLSGTTLYAAFSSYCDQAQATTRGWLLGWNTANLAPIAHNDLLDAVPGSKSNYFLNSIWMSGYGPSTASANNSVYVVTSNSDANTFGANNPDESVLKLSSDLSGTQSFFTDPNRATLDNQDADLGAGGAMLSPVEPGLNPKLLFAAGKTGTMYMFDRAAGAGLKLLNSYPIGGCWCGPSYFTGADGVGRIVTSGGSRAIVWRLNTSASAPASLTQQSSTQITSGQEGGFFTSISSNGTAAGSAIVWAVGRPTQAPGTLPLYAIDPTTGKIIYTATAGNWISGNSNANTVPTVANGHVYVASYKELAIFGLGGAAHAGKQVAIDRSRAIAAEDRSAIKLGRGEHVIWGTIRIVDDTGMVIADRRGASIRVDLTTARVAGNVAEPVVGQTATVIGKFAANGSLVAKHVEHAKASPLLWSLDQ